MAKKKIKDIVAEELEDFLKENGYELYNVEFVKEGKDWFLRVYIDKVPAADAPEEENYISTDDCETISRYLSERLDETDPIPQNYYLEVSSPGLIGSFSRRNTIHGMQEARWRLNCISLKRDGNKSSVHWKDCRMEKLSS